MQVKIETRKLKDCRADALLVAAGKDWAATVSPLLRASTAAALRREMAFQSFNGKDGETAIYQSHGAAPWRYIVLLGVGDGKDVRTWYNLAHRGFTKGRDLKLERAALWIPPALLTARVAAIISEATLLSAYRFDTYKSKAHVPKQTTLALLCPSAATDVKRACARGRTIAAATLLARDLIHTPAAVATPQFLANAARKIARSQHLQLRILDAAEIKRARMGALLGVAQGSVLPPRFIELIYRPPQSPPKRVALVGKGITFDSGGLSLKTAESMQTQKRDMAGAAAVLGVMSVVRELRIRAEVRAYIPCAENMPSGRALRPGDVVRAVNGKTIEVLNTDAEGRLVLADALAYAAKREPDVIIDMATLTAAVRTALGARYAGILGNNAEAVQALIAAGKECAENLWELPLVNDYRADLDSSIADLKNIGETGTGAGTIIGALFLREFVGNTPWCHIDFSSTVMADKPFPCHPRGATGFGVRTLLRYLQDLGGGS